jgi:HEAT repeat protein
MAFTADTLAAQLARAVDLFRDPARKEDQKRAFRALVAMLQEQSNVVRAVGGHLWVNGAPVDGPQVEPLLRRLELHGVSELTIQQTAPVSQIFALLRTLAEQPGWPDDVDAKLRASGASEVSVSMTRHTDPPPEEPPPPTMPARPDTLGTRGVLRGNPMSDIASPAAPVGGVADVHQISPVPEDSESPAPAMSAAPAAPAADLQPPEAAPPPIEQDPTPAVFGPAAARTTDTLDLLDVLEREPHGAGAGDTLAALVRQSEEAAAAGKVDQVLRIICGIVRIEHLSPQSGARRLYGIALKRMFTKSTLEGLARLTAAPSYRADAIVALTRAGADGTEVLLDRLVAAPSADERRQVFSALTQIKQGADQLVHLLGHHQWFVVRNIAELAGELGAEEAVPALAKQLEHEDERVRKAVALALAKIGSRNTAEALRRALRDPSAGVRLQVALGVGGRRASALALLLTGALEAEKEAEVVRELVLALGRIGSPEAVQALIKFVQPSGKLFGRRPTPLRVAAVDALRLAGSPAAVGTLQGLAGDGDREVRAAAQAALAELKKKG